MKKGFKSLMIVIGVVLAAELIYIGVFGTIECLFDDELRTSQQANIYYSLAGIYLLICLIALIMETRRNGLPMGFKVSGSLFFIAPIISFVIHAIGAISGVILLAFVSLFWQVEIAGIDQGMFKSLEFTLSMGLMALIPYIIITLCVLILVSLISPKKLQKE